MRPMRCALLVGLVTPFLALSGALADEPPSEEVATQLTELASQRVEYEVMLRDSRTETAAQYFLDQLMRIEHERRVLEQPPSEGAVEKQAHLPPAALLRRIDLWMRTHIRRKLERDDPVITDATSWTRREFPEELFVWLARWLGGDQPLSIKDAQRAWMERPRQGWMEASYGAGSYIVRPPTVKEPPETRQLRRGAVDVEDDGQILIPSPPTRDQWWERASITQRTSWVLAYLVERSRLFEVGEQQSSRCPVCKGQGLISKTLHTGMPLSYLCTRCVGAGRDIAVRFR